MNIRNDDAGCVSESHILKSGFEIYQSIEGSDMGQGRFSLPQYKNSNCRIIGGYWNYNILDNSDNILWSGWWNSNEEFDKTLIELNLQPMKKISNELLDEVIKLLEHQEYNISQEWGSGLNLQEMIKQNEMSDTYYKLVKLRNEKD